MMEMDGGNKKALTQTDFEEWAPTWVNEDEITFLRQKSDSIFRIKLNLKTKKETRIKHPTNCLLDDKNALFFGSLVVYTCKSNIFLFDTTSNETLNITNTLDGLANYPSWSHDGASIVFTSDHLGNNQIFEYKLSSKDIVQLTTSTSNNERGELSPDRKRLVYSTDYFGKGNQDIVLKDMQSGAIQNISNSPGMELIARFSADGKRLYFGTNKDDNWEIYSHELDSGQQTRLTTNEAFDGDPRVLKLE